MQTPILYLTYDGLLDPLGQSQILPYLRALQRKGFCFHIISFEKAARWDGVLALRRQLSRQGITWHPLRYHKWPSAPATLFDVLQGIRTARRILDQNPITIIHARSYVASLIALAVKTPKQKFVFDMRGFWPEERVEGGLWNRHAPLFHLAKWFEQKFFATADDVVVLTNAAARILRERYLIHKPISVIPTCVDTALFTPRRKDAALLRKLNLRGHFVLCYSGSIGTWYRFREMLAFFSQFRQSHPDAHLLLLSNNPEEMRVHIRDAALPASTYTLTSCTRAEMPRWLSLADATLFFITPSFSKQSSMPTKMGESLAMGIPVIANAGIGDCDAFLRKGTGVAIREFTENAYTVGIRRFQTLLRQKGLKECCRSVAERELSLAAGVQRYAQIYQT